MGGVVGELEIQHAILDLMSDGRAWSNADLKRKLLNKLPWSKVDLQASPSRPNEYRWENRVNNALSASRKSSLIGKGHVENAGEKGLYLMTGEGLHFIRDDWS